jgi:hypothetical protein
MARTMLADLLIAERPAEAIRLLIEVQEMTANDLLSSVVLSRAYQRARLCDPSVQWAKAASKLAPAQAALQAEPLVEYAVSLKLCAEEAQEEAWKTQIDNEAVEKFKEALGRLREFRSGAGGKIWYEFGGAVGVGWKYLPLKKDQYERLLVDTYAGLCEVEGRPDHTCPGIEACKEWIKRRLCDAEARFRMTLNAAAAAGGNLDCAGRRWAWPAVCDLYRSIAINSLPPDTAKHATGLGRALKRMHCPNLKLDTSN